MQKSLFLAKSLRKTKLIQKGFPGFINFSLKKKVNSSIYKIPIIRNIGWNIIFENEPWMDQLLCKLFISEKEIFIDVGMNIGQTLIKVKSILSDILYYGFEVNPVCLFYLNELIRMNKFLNTFVIPVGLSDETNLTLLNFFSKYPDDSTASVLEDIRPNAIIQKKQFAFLTTLDDLIHIFEKKIAVLKIDVEGCELEVLMGAKRTITKHRPIILIEILPAYSITNIWRFERQQKLENFLKSVEYKIIQIGKDKNNNMISLQQINNIGVNSNILLRDYILFPNEKKVEVFKQDILRF